MAQVDSRLTGAVAIWVKTPGLSPVKTRLAAGIGAAAAEHFYRLSADAVRAVARRAAREAAAPLVPLWAVAEPHSNAWEGLEVVPQGEGGLGERLSHVYDALLHRYGFAIFIGADAPQITSELIGRAAVMAAAGAFVLGPAEDGGFYLFAGSRPIPRQVWLRAPYSSPDTLRELAAGLRSLGPIRDLPTLFDVDTQEELVRLEEQLSLLRPLLPEQRLLAEWLAQAKSSPR